MASSSSSSRFVSGGTNEAPTERDEAWLAAQQELDSKALAQKLRPGEQEGGRSLYDTLQANKAAKQDAFEESIRLRNQFRSLDEDEAEFLASVLESTRAREAEVRRETAERLEAFRAQQQGTAGVGDVGSVEGVEAESWFAAGPRKRKKGREGVVGGVKVRRVSVVEGGKDAVAAGESMLKKKADGAAPESTRDREKAMPASPELQDTVARDDSSGKAKRGQTASQTEEKEASKSPAPGLGLVAYSSDEDEGD